MDISFRKYDIREVLVNVQFTGAEYERDDIAQRLKFNHEHLNSQKLEEYLFKCYPEAETENWEVLKQECYQHNDTTPGFITAFYLFKVAVPRPL